MDNRWLRLKPAAEELGLNPQTISRKAKEIGAYRNFGGTSYVDMTAIYEAIQNSETVERRRTRMGIMSEIRLNIGGTERWFTAVECASMRDKADERWPHINQLLYAKGYDVKRLNNTCFFARLPHREGDDGNDRSHQPESPIHKLYKDVFADLKDTRLLCKDVDVILHIKTAETECVFVDENQTRRADVMLYLDRTEPEEYCAKWNGKVAIEVEGTHPVEAEKRINYRNCNIAAFEFTIKPEWGNTDYNSYNYDRLLRYFTYDEHNHYIGCRCIHNPLTSFESEGELL